MTRFPVRRVAALLAASALLLGAPAAASASPAAIDPACAEFAFGGYVEVGDPANLPSGLPSPVTVDDMSCVLDFPAVGELARIFAYLDDPFAKFLDMADGFAALGWGGAEIDADGAEGPLVLQGLPGRAGEDEIQVIFRGGDTIVSMYYATDATAATFGIGTFVAVFGGGDGADIDAPSTISDLRTIADAAPTPAQAGVLVVSAGLLTLLLAVPAFLLSRVLSDRYAQWFGWLDRGRLGRWRERLAAPRSAGVRWLLVGAGMLVASWIAAFIDPRFGFNGLSVRLYLTLLATFVLFNVGAWAVVTLVLRRVQPDARPALTFHPASLVVVALAVLLSRLLQFDPGVVFGLVAGTTFAVTLALSREAVVVIVGTAYAAAIALVAWIGYSAISAAGAPGDAGLVALTEFLGGLTLEGVSTLPIALVPLATFDGGVLFRWRRAVWAVVYAAGLALFLLVLFDLPGGVVPVDAGFWNWLGLFAVFAVVATGVWIADLVLRRTRATTPASPQ